MRITWKKTALKTLLKIQPAKAADIREKLALFAAAPDQPNNNLKSLEGVENGYRLRVGDWRVSFTLDEDADEIDVFEVAPRGGAYRW